MKWGDYLGDDGTPVGFGYRWNQLFSFQCHLIKRAGESDYRVMFIILYGNKADIDAILDHSRNITHKFILQRLGLSEAQLETRTYLYDEPVGWTIQPYNC